MIDVQIYSKAHTNAFLAWIPIIRRIKAGEEWCDIGIVERLLACSTAVLAEMIQDARRHEQAADLGVTYDEYVRLESR